MAEKQRCPSIAPGCNAQCGLPAGHYGVEIGQHMWNVGKKAAGRLLDGREWNEYPGVPLLGTKSEQRRAKSE